MYYSTLAHQSPVPIHQFSPAIEKLGSIHQALGQTDKAVQFFELFTKLGKELYESNPKSEALKNGLAISYSKLGEIHQVQGQTDKALQFFELRTKLGKELYESNPKNEALKNGLAISYFKLGLIHQAALGQTDKALQFFELRYKYSKELYESNPKSVELKNGLAISYYKLGGIYQDKQQAQKMYQQAIHLWQELYELTGLETYKKHIENAKNAYLQAKIVTYASFIQLTFISLFAGFYWLDWLSIWWLVGALIWFFPLHLPPKIVLAIKLVLLVVLMVIAWVV